MNHKTIYILHKNGADSHYTALSFLLQKNNVVLKYREFSFFGMFFKSIFKLNGKQFVKQLLNAFFILNLLFTRNKKIVLGIAPFDYKLGRLIRLLKKHEIYYHTSWTYWDKSFYPKTKKVNENVLRKWQAFLENTTKHIYAVTEQSKKQLLENYNINDSKVSIVYHALDEKFTEKLIPSRKRNSFIYLGRLVPQKGIEEILEFFAQHTNCHLTIIGKGKQEQLVQEYAHLCQNINYKKYTKNTKELTRELSQQEYVLLNSKRTKKWEELFGLIIIEGMAQGLIPIAPKHSGPKEIISENIGYLFDEGELKNILSKIILNKKFNEEMSDNAREKSTFYLPKNIANNWESILN